jgi:hypothetical protein
MADRVAGDRARASPVYVYVYAGMRVLKWV